jgi:hypothetical protein
VIACCEDGFDLERIAIGQEEMPDRALEEIRGFVRYESLQ